MIFPLNSFRAGSASSAPPRSRPPSCRRDSLPPLAKTLRISLPRNPFHAQPQESVRLTKPKQKTPTAQVRKKTLRISPKKSAQVRKLQPLLKLMRILAHS